MEKNTDMAPGPKELTFYWGSYEGPKIKNAKRLQTLPNTVGTGRFSEEETLNLRSEE